MQRPPSTRRSPDDSGPRWDREHFSRDLPELLILGWQEQAALPELGLDNMPAKLDSGAVLSSLHVAKIRMLRKNACDWVRFDIGTEFGLVDQPIRYESPLIGVKRIQSSSGHREVRPVIETMLVLAGFHWTIELTLASRTTMQFPLLIGRDALAGRCLIDCSRTHLAAYRNA